MSEFKKFKRSLANHPGLWIATACSTMGFLAGLRREDGDFTTALIGAAVMSILWVPVLWTAWTMRNHE